MYTYIMYIRMCAFLYNRVRVAYALAADNSVLSVAQFLAQSVAISSIQLNTEQVPMLNGK